MVHRARHPNPTEEAVMRDQPALMSFADVEELHALRRLASHLRANNRQLGITGVMLGVALGLFFGGAFGSAAVSFPINKTINGFRQC